MATDNDPAPASPGADPADDTTTGPDAGGVTTPAADAAAAQHSFFTRLYTGTGAFEVVGKRRMWFAVSGAIVAVSLLSILIRGFTFGIDFQGGTQVSFPRGDASVAAVEEVYRDAVGADPSSVVTVGSGDSATVQIRSEQLDPDQIAELRNAIFVAFSPTGPDGVASPQTVSDSDVSSTWGGQITEKALIALAVFLVLVGVYITIRYERFMATAALAALAFDLTVTAGIYALVGFEVTPATVIGLLTILGFSLYDTVIVFDKVEENTHGFHHTTRRTFAEQANLAINQTFMRSINTSLISVIPVLSLIVVAVVLLGVGTLQDLALVQLVGILVGTYSSIYFATPLLVSLRERTELVSNHTRRVLNRRGNAAATTADTDDAADERSDTGEPVAVTSGSTAAPSRPTRPSRPSRPTRQGGAARPSGKRGAPRKR